ncbi:hypothetical protein MUJ63_06295 [Lachnospiraceae bacterium NSJ-143]|nr:hypothetical protein [Lachnospiraceae bacterium NSJ-143]
MTFGDIVIIISVVVVVAIAVMYHFGKKNYAKNLEAQTFIDQYKTVTPILVIDKKFEKPTPQNLPKNIYEKLPKTAHIRKMPIVKAKVGPQITTLMCDKSIYNALAVKKTVKVELAGIYISRIVGMNLEDKKKKTIGQKVSLWLQKNQPNK